MTEQLCDYVAQKARYDTPDENGETRREFNARYGMDHKSPEDTPPDVGSYLLVWFWDMSRTRPDSFDGCGALTPEYVWWWATSNGEIVTRRELAILRQMDAAFRAAFFKEREAQRKRNERK